MKYELTNESLNGLCRIRALRDIPRHGVKAGDLGGWVESEKNLSQEDDCWVGGEARVHGDARVYWDATVCGKAVVGEKAQVYGDAVVGEKAQVYGDACICGNARVYENAWVLGNTCVYGDAQVYGEARVYENAWVFGNTQVCDYAHVYGAAMVSGTTQVCGYAQVDGNARILQNGVINSTQDYLVIGPMGSRDSYTTFYKTQTGICVCCGCFNGSIDEFLKKVKERHGNTGFGLDYIAAAEFAKTKLR